MHKHISFVITAAVLLAAAFTSLALYTIHIANAQSNMTSAGGAKNMTKGSNMTEASGTKTLIHIGKPANYRGNNTGIHTAKPVCRVVEIVDRRACCCPGR